MQGALEAFPILAVNRVVDHRGCDPGIRRALQSDGVGAVRYHEADLRGIIRFAGGLDQRGHVGAATGYQDGGPLAIHAALQRQVERAAIGHALVAASGHDLADHRRPFAMLAQHRQHRVGLVG